MKELVSELTALMEKSQQKATETAQFIQVVQNYEKITKLTPKIMHELIEKIVVHASDKSSGRRKQKIEIYFRFLVAHPLLPLTVWTTTKRERLRRAFLRSLLLHI